MITVENKPIIADLLCRAAANLEDAKELGLTHVNGIDFEKAIESFYDYAEILRISYEKNKKPLDKQRVL